MVTARSVEGGLTRVVAVAVLLPGVVSAGALTVAVSDTLAPTKAASTVALTTTVWLAPAGTVPRAQVMICPETVHTPPWSVETKTSPVPSVSVSVTPVASEGPAFATTTEYVTGCPGSADVVPDLVTDTSAWGADAVVLAVALLLPDTGSTVDAVTVAVSVTVAPWATPVASVAATVSVAVAPGARVPMVHVVVVQVAPVMPVTVRPVPGASVSTTPVAVDGPLFVTVTV